QRSREPFRAGPVMSLSGLWQLAQFPRKSFSPWAYKASSARAEELRKSARTSARAPERIWAVNAESLDRRDIPNVLGRTAHRWSGGKNRFPTEPGGRKGASCHGV